MTLCDHVKIWPTPQAHKTTRSGKIVNADGTAWDGKTKPHSATTGRPITTALADAVAMWPTPCASEARQGLQIRREGKKGTQESLSTVVRRFPTPRTPSKSGGGTGLDGGSGARSMMTEEERKELCGGQLNPTWVEWLMGWPLGWTDCAVSATDKFRQWQRSHGIS
jgi:DNA (cytosine-5)-methyltransferase 1